MKHLIYLVSILLVLCSCEKYSYEANEIEISRQILVLPYGYTILTSSNGTKTEYHITQEDVQNEKNCFYIKEGHWHYESFSSSTNVDDFVFYDPLEYGSGTLDVKDTENIRPYHIERKIKTSSLEIDISTIKIEGISISYNKKIWEGELTDKTIYILPGDYSISLFYHKNGSNHEWNISSSIKIESGMKYVIKIENGNLSINKLSGDGFSLHIF